MAATDSFEQATAPANEPDRAHSDRRLFERYGDQHDAADGLVARSQAR